MASIAYRTTAPKSGFTLSAMIGRLVAWNDQRVTRKSLNQLTARELEDIGLVRSDIDAIARGTLIR